jgi:hypothetical protein
LESIWKGLHVAHVHELVLDCFCLGYRGVGESIGKHVNTVILDKGPHAQDCHFTTPQLCTAREHVQAIHNPEDFITACEASWRPELLVDSPAGIDVEHGILAESHAGVFLRRCRLAFVSMPFEVRPCFHYGLT